ncbi:MAG TPA: thioredoxin family protein [Thermoplasmata archaeon]|nr:thioredoxin family protein [Thermoplasmata archaeon]
MAELSTFRLHPGDPAPEFDLPGVDGRSWALKDFAGTPWLAVVFTCNHCPYAQAWEGRLIELQRRYADRGLRIVLINPNETVHHPEDRFEIMVERAKSKGYPFPYLRDDSQEVARAYGALVTPHPMLFNRERRLVFQGRIDDNHERPERVQHTYLKDALEASLAGRPVARPELPVLGCSVKWAD